MFNFAEDLREINIIAPAKRVEGCALTGLERDEKTNDVIFTFTKADTNGQLKHREFFPKKGNATDEVWKSSVNLTASRLAHIVQAYVTKEEYQSIKVSKDSKSLDETTVQANWLEVTSQIGKLLKPKIKEGKTGDTALKVVYRASGKGVDKKYYSSLPQVPPFISTPNHPKDFTYDPKYDIFEIPSRNQRPDSEPPVQGGDQTNAFSNAGAASGDDDF